MTLCESPPALRDSRCQSALDHLLRDGEREGKASWALDNPQPSNGLFCFHWPISGDFLQCVHVINFPSQFCWAWAIKVSLDSLSMGLVRWCKSWVRGQSQSGRQPWMRVMSHLLSLGLVHVRYGANA